MARLLDLRLFELDVLANNRVVLAEHELVRRALAILRGRVEKTGVRRRDEADQFTARLTFFRHDYRSFRARAGEAGAGSYGMANRELASPYEPSSSSASSGVPFSVVRRGVPPISAGVTPGKVVVF